MSDTNPAAPFPPHAVAIVGLAGRFPGAADLDAFWRNIRDGVDCLQDFTDAELDAAGVPEKLRGDPAYVRAGTALEGLDQFDAAFFGMTPREAQILDPQHRLFLECAVEALEHAGHGGERAGSVGVYAGAGMNTYLLAHILRDPALVEAAGGYQLMLGNDKDFLCTRVSYKLDLRGPSVSVQTACSTSLVAVEMACRALQRGDCDMALAGGVSASFPARSGYLYQEGMILSPDGRCRPFDAAARGTRPAAGAGIVVLKRLADAIADCDTVHAVIRGAAVNNDGANKAGFTAPSVDGQVEVIATAQMLAGVEPRSITYLEAHGTGTPLGDPIEIAALTEVFRAATDETGFCRLGSLKANLGHLDTAAGVAGLIKTVLALKHREIPPLVNFTAPNPQLELDSSPFAASARGSAWNTDGTPRRAGVSSFGIGGTNAHVVLEEAPPLPEAPAGQGPQLLVLSARTATALEQATSRLAAHLEAHPDASLADVAWTLQAGRRGFAHRRALVADSVAGAIAALRRPNPALTAVHEGGTRPVAFLFSGQGSQHPGMAAGLYRHEPAFREALDRCAALLAPHLGLDLRPAILGEHGAADLNDTRLTQPALFAVEYALAQLWLRRGVQPAAMLGHSVGEYVAAHLAGVLSLADALRVVAARGRLMAAMPAGGMAAVQLGAAALRGRLPPGVEIAAINAPELCTVAGPREALDATLRELEAAGIACRRLHTSHAFHSAMMEPAMAELRAVLAGVALQPPAIPYLSNLSGTWITAEQATAPAYYASHMRQAVQFEAGIRTLAADPTLFLLEIGPGTALATLARANLDPERGRRHVAASLPAPRAEADDLAAMLDAAARLWLAGVALEWDALRDPAARRVPLPTYPFERQRFFVDRPAAPAQPEAGFAVPAIDHAPRCYAPGWLRDDSLANEAPRLSGQWLLLGDGGALTGEVAAQLRGAGAAPVLVLAGEGFRQDAADRFAVLPGASADIARLRRALPGPVNGAVVLWGLEPTGAPQRDFFDPLVALGLGLDDWQRDAPCRVVVATTGAQSVLDEPVRAAETGLATGAVLVLPTEVSGLRMRAVDLDPGRGDAPDWHAAAAALLAECAAADEEKLVARRAGRRWVRRYERVTLPRDAAPMLRPRGRYLITGGLGGIGLQLARWLAGGVSARLLLTARRALPPRAEWDSVLAGGGAADWSVPAIRAIREIEAAGGEVIAAAADAADPDAMAAAIAAAAARWGGLDGVIHAAGVPGSGRIASLSDAAEAARTIAPKLGGLDVLVQLLGAVPLDFVALMSSINAVVGAPGACDYSAANAVLDSFPDSAQRPAAWRHVCAMDWSAWREVGMAANLVLPEGQRAAHAAFLRHAIAPADGVAAFAAILASGRPRAVVTTFDLLEVLAGTAARPASLPAAADTPEVAGNAGAAPDATAPQSAPRDAGFAAPATPVEQTLAAIWSELTGVADIAVHDDFFQLGGHSLLATRVLARIEAALGVHLALRDVFDAPTIRQLAGRVEAASRVSDPMGEPGADPGGDPAEDDREEILI